MSMKPLKSSINESLVIRKLILSGYLPSYFLRGQLRPAEKGLEKSHYQIAIDKAHRVAALDKFSDLKAIFKKKYKIGFDSNLKRAKAGNVLAIENLLSWDITYLFENWLRRKIVAAWAVNTKDGRALLDSVSDAIKSRKNRRKSRKDTLVQELRHLKVTGFNFNDNKKVEQLRVAILNILEQIGVSKNDSEYKLLIDKNYFIYKWLVRNKLREDTKI